MSTKRLDKTAIEGGRSGYSKYERRNSHTSIRASERTYCQLVKNNPELADDLSIEDLNPVFLLFRL